MPIRPILLAALRVLADGDRQVADRAVAAHLQRDRATWIRLDAVDQLLKVRDRRAVDRQDLIADSQARALAGGALVSPGR